MMKNRGPRPLGKIRVYDEKGYAYLPKSLREELGLTGVGDIPYFIDANTVLLIRKGASKREVMEGIKLLMKDLDLRWKE